MTDEDDRPDGTYSIVKRKRPASVGGESAPADREPARGAMPPARGAMPPARDPMPPARDPMPPARDPMPAPIEMPATAADVPPFEPFGEDGFAMPAAEAPAFEPIDLPGALTLDAKAAPEPLGIDLREPVDPGFDFDLSAPLPDHSGASRADAGPAADDGGAISLDLDAATAADDGGAISLDLDAATAADDGGAISLDLDAATAADDGGAISLDLDAPVDVGAAGERLELDFGPESAPARSSLEPIDLAPGPSEALELDAPAPPPVITSARPAAGGPALGVTATAPAPSAFARSAAHADKNTPFKRVLPRPQDPWIKRKMWHLIFGAILMVAASYIYGCTKVMGDSISFRREMPDDLETELRTLEQNGGLDPARIEQAMKRVAARHDMDVVKVIVTAEPIGNIRHPNRTCTPANWPLQTIMRLHPVDQANLVRAGQRCGFPDFVLTIQAHVSERWGLFERAFEEVAVITAHKYDATGVGSP